MSGTDDDLRRTLRERADDVRPRRDVPPGLERRARRRIALNGLVGGITAAVVVAGLVVGIRAFTGGETPPPVPIGEPSTTTAGSPGPTTSPTGPAQSPTTGGAAAAPCTAADLRAVGNLGGAAGSREGVIDLTNFSDAACSLEGRPTVTLLASPGHPIATGIDVVPADAGWRVDGRPEPDGWPMVTLDPGAAASVRLRWGNWCPQGRAAPLWELGIPGGGSVEVTNGLEEAPPCNGPGAPSTVEVGPFEPHRSA